MFVLLPSATISHYKTTFIFPMCTNAPVVCTHFDTICLFYPVTLLRVITRWQTIAHCSMKWNSEKQPRDAQQRGTIPFNSSHLSPLTAVLWFWLSRERLLQMRTMFMKAVQNVQLLATIRHPKLFILDLIMLLHRYLRCGVHLYLSPATDNLIEFPVSWTRLLFADKDALLLHMHILLESFLFWQTELCLLFISLHHCPSPGSKRGWSERHTKYRGMNRWDPLGGMLRAFELISQG